MSQLQTDLVSIAGRHPSSWTPGPTQRLAVALLGGLVVVSGVAGALAGRDGGAIGLALAGYLAAAFLLLRLIRRGYPHQRLGLGNLVTLLRMALAAALLAPMVGGAAPWTVFAVAAVAFALDGADGWLARREGRVSEFGSRFDMEVDSALALILALNAWAAGAAGAIVLLIGVPRYAFAAVSLALPWLDRPVPERFSRKLVCVLQVATLIALQLPWAVAGGADPAIIAIAAVLAWSFGRDVLWLWRTRP